MAKRADTSTRDVEAADRKASVVQHYGDCGTLLEASRRAGEDYSTVRYWKEHDPNFAYAIQQADETYVQTIEAKAGEVARSGDPKLLMFLLKCLDRNKYGDTRKIEHSGPGGMPINIVNLDQVKAQLIATAYQFPTVAPRLRQSLQEILDALPKSE